MKERASLSTLDAAGEPIVNRSTPSQADEFLRVFGELGPMYGRRRRRS